jgi:ubiquinone/menaquinone biosynthesis C-methylase UbiE
MNNQKRPYICPAELAGSLDNHFRRLFHNPRKILGPFINMGMTVLDLGCGPGYFTGELAVLVGDEGRVIAADLQEKMLAKMSGKVQAMGVEKRVEPHKCLEDKIGIVKKVDFVLAFWMVHEVPDQLGMFEELRNILNSDGLILVVEPKIHVTKRSFNQMITYTETAGFEIIERPKVAISRAVLLSVRSNQ